MAAKYAAGHALMIGDAPGDYKAAEANHALFFPINPGAEEASWQRFYEEGIDRFLSGTFAGSTEGAAGRVRPLPARAAAVAGGGVRRGSGLGVRDSGSRAGLGEENTIFCNGALDMTGTIGGVVYVLTNPAMPGLTKIGQTTQEDIAARMSQLYSTGVPVPFECRYAC